nr:TRAP transporter large permease subunit [Prolixibacteraceae bacterium]
ALVGIGLNAANNASGLLFRIAVFVLNALVLFYIGRLAYKKPQGFKRALKILWDAIPSLMLLVIVIGGILAGLFTATEASAVAVVYALILALVYKEMKISDLPQVILQSVRTTSIVLLLVATCIGYRGLWLTKIFRKMLAICSWA